MCDNSGQSRCAQDSTDPPIRSDAGLENQRAAGFKLASGDQTHSRNMAVARSTSNIEGCRVSLVRGPPQKFPNDAACVPRCPRSFSDHKLSPFGHIQPQPQPW